MHLLKKTLADDKFIFRFLIIWLLILSILYSFLSVLRHVHFQSGGFDLGIFDQAIYQYSHFLFPYNTIKEMFILGDHLNLTLPLLSPLYWIWQDVKTLLIFQAVFITVSSLAIYKLTRLRKFSPFVSLSLSFIYSIFWGIQFAVYFDFHPIVIGVGILAWCLYFFESKKWKLFWIALTLMFLTQENMGIALASVGIIYFFKKEYRNKSLLFIFGGLIVSLISVKIISLMSPVGYQYWPEFDLNPIYLLIKFFDNPDKILVWFYSFSWFSFLPLLSPATILAVSLDLSQYFLPQKQFGHMITPFLHERAILAPIIILGILDILKFLEKRKINITVLSVILVLSVLLQQFIFHFPLNKLSKSDYWKSDQWMEDNKKLFAEIPKNSSLAAAQNLVPHLSERKEIYLIYPRLKDFKDCKGCWWLEFSGKPKFLVVDLHPNQWTTQLLESNENFTKAVRNMELAKKIIKVKNVNQTYLYEIIY
ncbi:MAG: hypothetical protein A2171_01310 [Candidatus Levybacteria bacterium RBG_13_35_9]|nr:MAG: hypothetical protein A2171_01310 [Candidatus Levybacteria bacterium RBG_13_35_9]